MGTLDFEDDYLTRLNYGLEMVTDKESSSQRETPSHQRQGEE